MKINKILMIGMPILLVILTILSSVYVSTVSLDSVKFKKEYEKYNNMKDESGNEYFDVNINKKNPIKYSSYEEILGLIENGTGIIYFGYPTSNWCRSTIQVLLDCAIDNKINKIYYLNVYNDRDSYIVEDGKLVYALSDDGKELKGTDNYHKLLEALDDNLLDYIIELDGKKYYTLEKRMYFPTIVFVKNGDVIGIDFSTISTSLDYYHELSNDEYDELYSIYNNYIKKIK